MPCGCPERVGAAPGAIFAAAAGGGGGGGSDRPSGRLLASVNNCSSVVAPLQHALDGCRQMRKRRKFMHWYTGEGMDQMEFEEAEEAVAAVIDAYATLRGV